MRRTLKLLLVAAALIAGLTSCRTIQHDNGCVEIVEYEVEPTNPWWLFGPIEGWNPDVYAWETDTGSARLGYTRQPDPFGPQATIWTTPLCAAKMDPYPPSPNP